MAISQKNILVILAAILAVVILVALLYWGRGPKDNGLINGGNKAQNEVQKILAGKHGKNLDEVKITIIQEEGNHIRGVVEFAEGGPGNIGFFLANRELEGWNVVYDGNGSYPCYLVEEKDFPTAMIMDCEDYDFSQE